MSKKQSIAVSLIAMLCSSVGIAQQSTTPPANTKPAQQLVDRTVNRHPELIDVLLHVTPPHQMKNVVVAAHLHKDLGEISGDDDLGVARTGKPLVEVQKDGVRIGVLLQLRDVRHRSIGAVGLMFPWHAGDQQARFLDQAEHIRDEMAAQIASQGALFEKS